MKELCCFRCNEVCLGSEHLKVWLLSTLLEQNQELLMNLYVFSSESVYTLLLTSNLSGNMLRTEDTYWQKCVTSTCFDGRVSWAEDRNGWDTFTLTYQEGNTA